MTSTWLTADLHFGHQKVSEVRGFKDTREHDDFIVSRWQRMVRPDDEVWVLGDISAGGSQSQLNALATLLPLPGHKYLVAGNHDSVHPMHGRKVFKWMPFYYDVFEYVCSEAQLTVEGEKLRLSHFPSAGDHTEISRYPEWRPNVGDAWLLHGHTHSMFPGPMARLEINVGLDAWKFKPVNLGEIGKVIRDYRSVYPR